MNAYVGDANRRLNWNIRNNDSRPRQLAEVDVVLTDRCACHADGDCVAPGIAGISLYCKLVIVYRCGVVVEVD